MKDVMVFYLKECPYCVQARKALENLISENPEYGKIKINWIEESENPQLADEYDYYATPSMFIGKEKIYEAHLFEKYDECYAHVKEVLDMALQG